MDTFNTEDTGDQYKLQLNDLINKYKQNIEQQKQEQENHTTKNSKSNSNELNNMQIDYDQEEAEILQL